MWLLLAFIAVPLIEIGLFIKVGGWLTLWPTLAIVLLTGLLGTYLVRLQGLKVLNELRGSLREMRDPLSPLAHGAMILFAGALLLTPGFFTDAIGFLLLVPAVRLAVIRYVGARVKVRSFSAQAHSGQRSGRADVVDGEFEDVTPSEPAAADRIGKKPSGWTEH